MLARQKKLDHELEEAKKNAPLPAPDQEEDEEDKGQRQLESDLAK